MAKQQFKFIAAPSAPFDDDEASKYGPILHKIARSFGVNAIAHIDKHKLFELVEADAKHPLRGFVYNNTTSDAERAYRIERCRKLISGIRYIDLTESDRLNDIIQKANIHKLFVPADAPVVENESRKLRKTNVFRPDLLKHDPSYISAISRIVKQMRDSFAQLDDLASARVPPRGVAKLVSSFRSALAAYDAQLQDEAAE